MDNQNWRNFIKEKFEDATKYRIEELENGEYVQVSSLNSSIETKIEFVFIDENELEDIHFWGSDQKKCGIWMSHFTLEEEFSPEVSDSDEIQAVKSGKYFPSHLPFNQKIIDRVENEWLYIPLKIGWTEKSILVGNKVYKSELIVASGFHKNLKLEYKPTWTLNIIDHIRKLFNSRVKEISYKFEPLR